MVPADLTSLMPPLRVGPGVVTELGLVTVVPLGARAETVAVLASEPVSTLVWVMVRVLPVQLKVTVAPGAMETLVQDNEASDGSVMAILLSVTLPVFCTAKL